MIDTVFVLSAGHSGSTLLDLLVGSHSRVASLGEITYLPRSIVRRATCSCGTPVPECGFWQEVVTEVGRKMDKDLFADPYALDLGLMKGMHRDRNKQTWPYFLRWKAIHGVAALQNLYGLSFLDPLTDPLRRAARNNFMLFDSVRKAAGVDLVVDSSKVYSKGIALYKERPANVRFLLLHRDGRGVMHSHLKRGVDRDAALEAWRGYYARALPLLDKVVNPAHVLRVAYEDLVAEPEERLRRICRFLQLDFEPGMLDFSSRVHHTPEGNDMRHGSPKIRADDGWRTGMSAPDLAYFQRKAGDINRRLGYAERAGTTLAVGSLDLETARSL